MNNINELQNNDKFLCYLFAQRLVYSKAKKIEAFLITLNFILWLLGLFLILQSDLFNALYVVWIIFHLLFLYKIKNMKIKAANIQELFDRKLFDLELNQYLIGSQHNITQQCIKLKNKHKSSYIKELENLKNWYRDVSDLPKEKAILLCQKENALWDKQLREKYQLLIWLVLIVIILIYIVIYHNNSVLTLLNGIYYIIPLFLSLVYILYENHNNISNNKQIDKYLENLFANINISIAQLEQIQELILDKRKNSVFVPDWFYRKFRSKSWQDLNEQLMYLKDEITRNG